MPRVNSVKKARKAQGRCGRCGKEIGVGDAYLWIKPRYGGKRIRCMETACRFRASDLTGGKMSGVYAAMESAEDALAGGAESIDDLKEIAGTAAEDIRAVAEEYRESAEAISEHFEGSSTAEECEEKADELEGWVDEIESALDDFDEFEPEAIEEAECPDCGEAMVQDEDGTWHCEDGDCEVKGYIPEEDEAVEKKDSEGRTEEEWLDAARDALSDVLSSCPV